MNQSEDKTAIKLINNSIGLIGERKRLNITCPNCGASETIDEFRQRSEPQIICPVCKNSFTVKLEQTGVEIIQKLEVMACPKCGIEQPRTDACSSCGIVISKYIKAREEKLTASRMEQEALKAEYRRSDRWFSDLFNHRTANLVRIILVCSVPLLFLIMCTMASKQKRPSASNKVIDVGSTHSKALTYDQSGYVVKKVTPSFAKALQLLNENIDLCISQCRSYKEAWYPQGEVANPVNMKFQLTDSMSSNLEILKKNYEQLKSSELRDVLIPGATQSKCEHFIIRLAGLHEELYMKANSYHSVYNDLDAILNEAAGKKNELNNEMAECRQ